MGYKALVPITHRRYAPSFLLVFADGQVITMDFLDEEYIEQAVEGMVKIIQVDGTSYFVLSEDGQDWKPIDSLAGYDHVA